jgi:hypothetical protein
LFIQEYYGINPSAGTYNWTKFDATVADIIATGAMPWFCICNKPAYMFTGLPNQNVVTPNSWTQWNTMVTALVNHVKTQFGLTGLFWEVMNEPDIGETGGCPYLFPSDGVAMRTMYANTRSAILSADGTAKVGGCGFSNLNAGLVGGFLNVAHSNGDTLDFFTFHRYDTNTFAQDASSVLTAAGYPSTIPQYLTEWNFSSGQGVIKNMAYVCAETGGLLSTALTGSHYYHIQDGVATNADFSSFMATPLMQNTWNGGGPYNFGAFDAASNRLPQYYPLKYIRNIVGTKIPDPAAALSGNDLSSVACLNGSSLDAVIWAYTTGATHSYPLFTKTNGYGYYEVVRVDPASTESNANELLVASGAINTLSTQVSPSLSFNQFDVYYLKTRPIATTPRRPSFVASVGGSNPAPQTVTISYNGNSPSSSFTVTSDSSWLTVTPVSGSGNGQVFNLAVNVAGFSLPGTQCAFVSISRGDLDTTVLEVDLLVAPQGYVGAQTVLQLAKTPTTSLDPTSYEMGVKFIPAVNGHVTGVMFIKMGGVNTTRIGNLWSSTGTLLGTTSTFDCSTTSYSGWQSILFPAPIAVTAGQTYVASVSQPGADGVYPSTSHGFDAAVTNSSLTAPIGAGVYSTTPGTFPNQSYNNSNYFRDVLFTVP